MKTLNLQAKQLFRTAVLLFVVLFTSLTAMATEYITDVMLIGAYAQADYNNLVAKYTSQGWKATNWDLNHGIAWGSGDAILLLYKTAESNDGFNHDYITDFYIQNRSAAKTTETLNFMGRTYNLVPISDDSDDHFKGQYGDLNSHTGASTDPIHLYYTKETFADNRVVTGITFNDTKSGGVGKEGNTKTGYDLNAGCSDLTSQEIYMHLTTATAPVFNCFFSDLMLVGASTSDELDDYLNTYTAQGWKVINYDLNKGINWGDGDGIYLLYKTAISPDSHNHGYVTDFYLSSKSAANTQNTLDFGNDRIYNLVPYAGSQHFVSQKGDLNSGTGASTDPIHLYYTTYKYFEDGATVNGIYFDSNSSGAVGKDGNVTNPYNLNAGTTGDAIYMHYTDFPTWIGFAPVGDLESFTPYAREFDIVGWAYDPDVPDMSSSIRVDVFSPDNTIIKSTTLKTNLVRNDVNLSKGITGKHGFSFSVGVSDAPAGTYSVKVFALDLTYDGETQLGSTQTLNVTSSKVQSSLENVDALNGSIYVRGWAYDPDEPSKSVPVRVVVKHANGTDYKTENSTTDTYRSEVNEANGISGKHGFDIIIPADQGTYTVSVYADDLTGDGEIQVGTTQTVTVLVWDLELTDDGSENSIAISKKNTKTLDVLLRNRTLYKDGTWNTIVLPFDVTIAGSPLDGATVKPLTDATITGAQVSLTFGDAVTTLQAGQPYIIRWARADDYVDDDAHNIVNPVFESVTIRNGKNNTWNADHSVGFVGSYDAIKGTWADGSLLLSSDNTLHFAANDETLGALRAFVKVDNTKVESMPTAYTIDFGNGETATGSLNVVSGDANGDGQVSIADAVAIVNYILGNASADFNDAAADMNHDGHITITDAVALVNLIVK